MVQNITNITLKFSNHPIKSIKISLTKLLERTDTKRLKVGSVIHNVLSSYLLVVTSIEVGEDIVVCCKVV